MLTLANFYGLPISGNIHPLVAAPYLVTAPTIEPISVDEAKVQCRVPAEDGGENELFAGLVKTARLWAENKTHRKLITQQWDLKFDRFPCSSRQKLELPYAPLQSVASITYVDADGATQTWAGANYTVFGAVGLTPTLVDPQAEPGFVLPVYGGAWPTTRCQSEAVVVRVNVGYGDTAALVPDMLKHAIKVKVARLHLQREPQLGAHFLDSHLDADLLYDFVVRRIA